MGRRTRADAAEEREQDVGHDLIDRETGEARSQVVANVTASTVTRVLRDEVHPASTLMTDMSNVYRPRGQTYVGHHAVDHAKKEWAYDGWITTRTVEGFFGQLKRSLTGTFDHVSPEHLHRCLHAFDCGTRLKQADGVRVARVIEQAGRRRLTYREPTDG